MYLALLRDLSGYKITRDTLFNAAPVTHGANIDWNLYNQYCMIPSFTLLEAVSGVNRQGKITFYFDKLSEFFPSSANQTQNIIQDLKNTVQKYNYDSLSEKKLGESIIAFLNDTAYQYYIAKGDFKAFRLKLNNLRAKYETELKGLGVLLWKREFNP